MYNIYKCVSPYIPSNNIHIKVLHLSVNLTLIEFISYKKIWRSETTHPSSYSQLVTNPGAKFATLKCDFSIHSTCNQEESLDNLPFLKCILSKSYKNSQKTKIFSPRKYTAICKLSFKKVIRAE